MSRVAVVGSLHYDIMVAAPRLPAIGETLVGETWWWRPGGKGGNQAAAAARHGAAVQMIGCLGDDESGRRLRQSLEAAGVDAGHVREVAQGSGMSVAIQQDDGDYAAVVVSGANREIDAGQVSESLDVIRACDVLVLQNEIDETANVAAARAAGASGSSVVLNAAPARPLAGLSGLVDVLVVNAVEAQMLGAEPITGLPEAAVAARALGGMAGSVIVTAGPAGVALADSDGILELAAHEVGSAAAHGAGDVFVGALAARLAGDDAIGEAVRYANAAAALHVGSAEADRDAVGPTDVRRLLSDAGGG